MATVFSLRFHQVCNESLAGFREATPLLSLGCCLRYLVGLFTPELRQRGFEQNKWKSSVGQDHRGVKVLGFFRGRCQLHGARVSP